MLVFVFQCFTSNKNCMIVWSIFWHFLLLQEFSSWRNFHRLAKALLIWLCKCRSAASWGKLSAVVIAWVRTCWSNWLVGPCCCKACAGTWTVKALGCEAGLPGCAGMVICTGTDRFGSVMTSCWGLPLAAWGTPLGAATGGCCLTTLPAVAPGCVLVASDILAEAILASKRASCDLVGGSMVLLAVNLFSHKVLSSWSTFSSTASSRNESRTLVITSFMTEWYKLAAETIFELIQSEV